MAIVSPPDDSISILIVFKGSVLVLVKKLHFHFKMWINLMSMIGIRGLSGYSHWKLFAADCNQVAGPLAATSAAAPNSSASFRF